MRKERRCSLGTIRRSRHAGRRYGNVSPLLSPCTEDDEESPGVDNLEDVWLGVGVGLVTLPLLRVRWGHGVEWKELRMGGARCEVGDAGTAGRREVKSPPTRGTAGWRYRRWRMVDARVSRLTELCKFIGTERIDWRRVLFTASPITAAPL
jgi:hypothetical protein